MSTRVNCISKKKELLKKSHNSLLYRYKAADRSGGAAGGEQLKVCQGGF